MSYTPIEGVLDASWVGSAPYAHPVTIAVGDWREGFASVYPAGFRSSEIGAQFITKQQFIDPFGWGSAAYGTALGTLNWQYIPPYAAIDVLWVGAFSYTPPVSPFTATWIVGPPSEDISVYGTGFESSVFGEHLTWWPQFVSPDGLDTARFGWTTAFREGEYPPSHGNLHADWSGSPLYAPYEGWAFALWKVLPEGAVWAYGFDHSRFSPASHVWNKRQYIKPPGALTESFGDAGLILTAQGASVGGIAPPPQTGPNSDRQIPSPFIDFRTRYLTPTAITQPSNQVSLVTVTHEIQFVDAAGRGLQPGPFGTQRIDFANREISPPFIISLVFGTANVARIQVVTPSGWESSFISENHELDINLQRIFHHSGEADPTGYGATHVRNQFEVLHPTGWLSQNINFPVVYNLDQYLFVQPYMDTNSDPTQWPPYSPFVENKTRTLGPGGWQSSRFSVIGNIVENAADPVLPVGLDATVWGPETFIAHRIRYVGPEGWDSFYNTQYTVIYNNAAVLAPQGWGSTQVGTPERVINLNRTVKHIFPYDGETVGTAFIAYRIRTVYPSLFYDVPSGFPEVRFNPYPVTPAGIAPPQFGAIYIDERFSIISPKSANVHPVEWVGEPIVENENKTLAVFPSDQFFPGIPKIANYVQYHEIGGGNLIVFGAHLISYRTKVIVPAPTAAPAIVVTHRIRNLTPDPPASQHAFPDSIDPPILPYPKLSTRTISVSSISGVFAAGAATVTTNNLRPLSIYDDGMIGIPAIPVPRPILPRSIPASAVDFRDQVSDGARLSPFNIYAPAGDQTPSGYRPPLSGAPIDSMAIFSRPDVSHFHRTVGPVPNHVYSRLNRPTAWGNAEFQNRRRVVAPYGLMSQRFPVPIFLGVPQYVEMGGDFGQPGIASTNEFGMHVIARYVAPEVNRTLLVWGLPATSYGTARVELLHRTLHLTGIPHRGNPQQGLTNPWGLALVGYPRRYVITAGETTLWGSAVIEYKNRTVTAHGFSANTLDDDDIEERIEPMRVTRRNPPGGVPSIHPTSVFGVAYVAYFNRTIFSRGPHSSISGIPRVRAASPIYPSGWDSLEVGDIDRWEAGKIKPHGDDLSIISTPRILNPLRPSGPTGGAVGAPRIGVPLYLLGIPEIGFAGPSVSNPFGCTNRVVTPLPILSQQDVPQPAVT